GQRVVALPKSKLIFEILPLASIHHPFLAMHACVFIWSILVRATRRSRSISSACRLINSAARGPDRPSLPAGGGTCPPGNDTRRPRSAPRCSRLHPNLGGKRPHARGP